MGDGLELSTWSKSRRALLNDGMQDEYQSIAKVRAWRTASGVKG